MGDRTSRPREIVTGDQSPLVEAALRDLHADDALVLRLNGKRASITVTLPLAAMLREGIRKVSR